MLPLCPTPQTITPAQQTTNLQRARTGKDRGIKWVTWCE